MGKKHFTEEQIAFALRQAESGTSVAEIIRKLGISEQTFYRWKKRFAGLSTSTLNRLVRAGEIKCIRLDRITLYPMEVLEAWLKAKLEGADDQKPRP
jgi:transposase-like protein